MLLAADVLWGCLVVDTIYKVHQLDNSTNGQMDK